MTTQTAAVTPAMPFQVTEADIRATQSRFNSKRGLAPAEFAEEPRKIDLRILDLDRQQPRHANVVCLSLSKYVEVRFMSRSLQLVTKPHFERILQRVQVRF